MTIEAIPPVSAQALAGRGEVALLDVRPPAAFARGHPAGALSVPFSPRGLAERSRMALPAGRPVVLVAPDDETADAAHAQLEGTDVRVRGVVAGGAAAWHAAGLPETRVGEVAIEALPALAAQATIVDVREPIEWSTGHVPGALLIPLGRLRDSLPAVPKDAPVVTICEAGVRSCVAAGILEAAGFTNVSHVPAGSSGYRRSGLPLAFPKEED